MADEKLDYCIKKLLEEAAELPDIHFAAKSGYLKKARELLQCAQERYLLLNDDSCHLVNSVDSMGRTPLFYACSEGHLKMIEMLVKEFQADASIKDVQGHTAAAMAALRGDGKIVMSLLADSVFGKDDTLLHYACAGGNTNLIVNLIRRNADTSARDRHFNTPLHVAALCGNNYAVATMINFGADLEMRGHCGRTVLHIACGRGNISLVDWLILEKGADTSARDWAFNTPLHVAALCGNKDVVLAMINKFGVDPKVRGHRGRTLLHSACGGGNVNLVEELILEYGADIYALDCMCRMPIHVAISCGNEGVISVLVGNFRFYDKDVLHRVCRYGIANIAEDVLLLNHEDYFTRRNYPTAWNLETGPADILLDHKAVVSRLDDQNNTPLHVAALWGKEEIFASLIHFMQHPHDVRSMKSMRWIDPFPVESLVETLKQAFHAKGHCGRTLLHSACIGGNITLVQNLISIMCMDVNARDDEMSTPLHLACKEGNIDVVEILIAHKADLSAQDSQNYTPLQVAVLCNRKAFAYLVVPLVNESLMHVACSIGNYEMMLDLFNHDKKSISSRDYQNNCPAHVAALWGQSSIMFTIMYHEIDFDLNLKGHLGRSVLHYACIGGHIDLVQELINHYKADITNVDDENNTPLHAAALHGNLDVVCWLLKMCIDDINAKGQDGRTLLHSACAGGNVTLVQFLISHYQADVMAVDDHQNTPLHVAVLCDKIDIVRMLIKKLNCDVNVRGQSGRTILHMACLKSDIDLIQTAIREFKADTMAVDDQNNFPIHLIALHFEKEVLYKMLNEVNFGLSIRGNSGQTLLHIACSQGDADLVQTLIIEHDADIMARDSQGNTPLHVAASSGNKEVVQVLIDEFHCDINVTGHGGRSLLHSACLSGNISLVQLLVHKYKAVMINTGDLNTLHTAVWCDIMDIIGCYLAHVDVRDETILHNACITGNTSLVHTLIIDCKETIVVTSSDTALSCSEMKVVSMLLREIKCEFSVMRQDSRTLLLACLKEELEILKISIILNTWSRSAGRVLFMLLDELMCDPRVKYQLGKLLLYLCCYKGHTSFSQILINKLDAEVSYRDDQNNTPLHIAAYHGREEMVSMLIDEFGSDVNARGHLGRSVLHSACIGGHVSLVSTLILQYKADISALDDQLHTPLQVAVLDGQKDVAQVLINEFVKGTSLLHVACSVGNSDMVRKLLQDNSGSIFCFDEQGNTPLHVAALWGHHNLITSLVKEFKCRLNVKGHLGRSLLHSICIGGHHELIEFYLGMNNTDLNYHDDEDNTPLHVAALHGKEKVVMALINVFNCDPNSTGHLGRSLLHSACCGGNVDLIRTIKALDLKANFTTPDNQNNTPLHAAALLGKSDVVEMVIKGFDNNTLLHVATLYDEIEVRVLILGELEFNVNCRGQGGRTLLHIAFSKGNADLAQALLNEYGADITARDDDYNTPLHVAALCDEIEVLLLILRELEFNVNSRGQGGRTLLHIAFSKGNADLAQALLSEYGADITARDDDYNTPLHVAALHGKYTVFLPSKFIYFDITLRGQYGRTVCHIACLQGRLDVVKALVLDHLEIFSSPDSDMNTPLHLAVLSDQEHVVLVLLNEFNCDPRVKGELGRSLLHTCCCTGNVSLAQTLISKHGLEVCDQDDENNTPLHIAAAYGRKAMVAMLIDKFGCSVTVRGCQGRSVLHSACSGGHVSLVRTLILDYKADVNANDDQRHTPLQVAVLDGKIDVAKTLMKDFLNSASLLHTACSVGNASIVQDLLKRNASAINSRDEEGNTPLHVALLWGQRNLISVLENECKCDFNAKGHKNRTLLHSACIGGLFDYIEFFLKRSHADLNSSDDEGNTPLHVAAAYCQERVVLALIDDLHCDPNSTGPLGRSLLHSACCGGSISLIRTLVSLNLNADFTTQDDQGNSPLHVAALCGRMEVIQSAIKEFKIDLGVKGQGGKTLLHIACERQDVDLAKALIDDYGADMTARDDSGNTPLHVAAMHSKTEVVLQLLKSFKVDVSLRGQDGRTLLHIACSEGEIGLVKVLVLENRSICNTQDKDMNTPLHLAVLSGKESVVLMLLNEFNCDPRVKGELNRSLLHICCSTDNVSLAQTLISKHALGVSDRDDENNTPLHVAAYCGKKTVVSMLIDEFGCSVNAGGYQGRSVLHSACSGGHVSLVRTLILDYKADVNAHDNQGLTPLQVAVLCKEIDVARTLINEFINGTSLLHTACSVGNASIVQDLLKRNTSDIYSLDEEGNTPLHVAALWGQEEVVMALINDSHCHPNSTGHLGRFLLHSACCGGNMNLIRTIMTLNLHADFSTRDYDGNTPLHVAAMCGQMEVIQSVIKEFGINLDLKGQGGRTLLHTVCENKGVGLAQALITDYGPDLMARDDNNNTPLHVAAMYGNTEVVLQLLKSYKVYIGLRGQGGKTLLHIACSEGENKGLRFAQVLISDYGADIMARDDDNNTPLHVAALSNNSEVVLQLLKAYKFDIDLRGQGGKTLLHIACSEGENTDVGFAQTLVSEYGADITVRDDNSNTPLHVAAMSCKTEVVLLLLKSYKFDIGLRGQGGKTLLHIACSEGEIDLVKGLVLEKACICNSPDDNMNTPLHLAALAGKDSVVWLLINKFKCDPRVKGQNGRSLLHMCSSTGNASLARTLVFNHALDVSERDDENNTPLHIAAYHGREKMVFMLIDEFNCTVEERGYQGRSVLHSACCGGHVSLAKTLIIQYKANIWAVDDNSYTPVQVAVLHSQKQLAQILLKEFVKGTSILHAAFSVGNDEMVRDLLREDPAAINSCDQQGNTPLHVAAIYGQESVVSKWIRYDPLINNDFHCDPNSTGNLGRSLLHSACSGNNVSLVHILVSLKLIADFTTLDTEGNTPLHVAALSGKKEMVRTLIDKFECDPTVRGCQGRSLLHSACAGGNADLVSYIWHHLSGMSLLDVDSNGDTVLHTASSFGHTACVQILLSLGAPILLRNSSGKTPVDVAVEEIAVLLRSFLADSKKKIYSEYDILQQKAEKKFSGAWPITRIFVIGNPGAGKSSLIETLKREKLFDYFRTVSVPPHTAGIIPSIHMSKQCGRILFYDFAGNPEYYSSHAAILENYSLSTKGDNIFIIVVDLREESKRILQYWTTFIRYQKFTEKKRYLIIAGSHLDSLKWGDRTSKTRFTDTCQDIIRINPDLEISYLMLNCCSPQSRQITELQTLIMSQTKDSPSYSLSVQASILLGLLEKDFKHVISCSIQSLLSHIKDTGIALPLSSKDLCLVLQELHDIGLLFLIFDKEDEDDKLEIILNISQLTNEVHRCLFSKDAPKNIVQHSNSEHSFNIGIIPLNVLRTILPEFISIECLVQLQYCHKISSQDITAFPTVTPSSSTDQSYLFFPALCTAKKSDVSWTSRLEIKYSIGWLARCVSTDCFPPRFLHVLLLRLVFKFTLSIPHSQDSFSSDHRSFKRRCTMWSTGVHWLMKEGVECMVELVDNSKGVIVIVQGGDEAASNFIKMVVQITDCVITCIQTFCQAIKPDIFLLDSTDEANYFKEDNMHAWSDLKEMPENSTVSISISGRRNSARILKIYKDIESHADDSAQNVTSYESLLPPTVRSLLNNELDWDNEVDRDLRRIAHHMLGWDVNLATPLGLTQADISDIKSHPHFIDPALQRREALSRWKNRRLDASIGALLQIFADAGHRECAEALCSLLKEKSSGDDTQTNSNHSVLEDKSPSTSPVSLFDSNKTSLLRRESIFKESKPLSSSNDSLFGALAVMPEPPSVSSNPLFSSDSQNSVSLPQTSSPPPNSDPLLVHTIFDCSSDEESHQEGSHPLHSENPSLSCPEDPSTVDPLSPLPEDVSPTPSEDLSHSHFSSPLHSENPSRPCPEDPSTVDFLSPHPEDVSPLHSENPSRSCPEDPSTVDPLSPHPEDAYPTPSEDLSHSHSYSPLHSENPSRSCPEDPSTVDPLSPQAEDVSPLHSENPSRSCPEDPSTVDPLSPLPEDVSPTPSDSYAPLHSENFSRKDPSTVDPLSPHPEDASPTPSEDLSHSHSYSPLHSENPSRSCPEDLSTVDPLSPHFEDVSPTPSEDLSHSHSYYSLHSENPSRKTPPQ